MAKVIVTKVIVKCPTCNKPVAWASASEFRPFCSDRCRLIDLGEWADGNRYIPSDAEHDDVTESDLSVQERPGNHIPGSAD